MKKMDRLYFILTYMFFIYPPFIWGLVEVYSDSNTEVHITTLIWNIIVIVSLAVICGIAIYFKKLHVPTKDETKYLIFGFVGNIVMFLYTFQVQMNIENLITIYLILLAVLFVFYILISKKMKPLELWILLPLFLLYDYIYLAVRGCGWDSSYFCIQNFKYDTALQVIYIFVLIFVVLYYVYKILIYRLFDFFKIANIIIVAILSYIMSDFESFNEEFAMTLIILYPFLIIVDFIVKLVNKNYDHRMLLFYIRTFAIFIIFMVLGVTDFYRGLLHYEVLSIMVTITYISLGISILKTILGIDIKDENPISVINITLKGPKYIEATALDVAQIRKEYNDILADHINLGDNAYSVVVKLDGKIIGFISAHIQSLSVPLEHIKEAYVNVVEIDVDHRNQGIATKLIRMCEHHFKSKGVRQIRAWSSTDKYEAINLWKKLGYGLSPALIHLHNKHTNVEGYYVVKTI